MFTLSLEAKNYLQNTLRANQKILIKILAGGCSGLQYKFQCIDFTNDINVEVFELLSIDNVEFCIEKKALIYLSGSVLSYKKTQTGYLLYFENPHLSFCGCGKSFKVDK